MPLRVLAVAVVGQGRERGACGSHRALPLDTGHFATTADVKDAGMGRDAGGTERYPAGKSALVVVAEQQVTGAPHHQSWAPARKGLTTAGFPDKK